jgi:hypothetical protein
VRIADRYRTKFALLQVIDVFNALCSNYVFAGSLFGRNAVSLTLRFDANVVIAEQVAHLCADNPNFGWFTHFAMLLSAF